jgi:hypothetical protein
VAFLGLAGADKPPVGPDWIHEVTADVGRVFQAVGMPLPPNIREADAEAAAPVR